jgi:hypothetical protein
VPLTVPCAGGVGKQRFGRLGRQPLVGRGQLSRLGEAQKTRQYPFLVFFLSNMVIPDPRFKISGIAGPRYLQTPILQVRLLSPTRLPFP